jgi:hypothetical protein
LRGEIISLNCCKWLQINRTFFRLLSRGCGAKRFCRSSGLRRGCRSARPKGPSPCSIIWLRAKTNAKPQAPSNPAPRSNSNLRLDPFPVLAPCSGFSFPGSQSRRRPETHRRGQPLQSEARNAKNVPESAICGVLPDRPAPTGSVLWLVPISNPRSAPRRVGRANLPSDASRLWRRRTISLPRLSASSIGI